MFAPFHILATEGKTHFDQSHTWHLEEIGKFCNYNLEHLMLTGNILVDLENEKSKEAATNWWVELTSKGGEGMVVKPLEYTPQSKGRMIQTVMKCQGSAYIRIIYYN